VVVIIGAGHWFYFIKTQAICIRLFKWKNHIDKVFPQLNNIDEASSGPKNDHGFGCVNRSIANNLELIQQMLKKPDSVRAFSV